MYSTYTTEVNSAFCVFSLASSEVISKVLIHLRTAKRNKMVSSCTSVTERNVYSAGYSACVVNTKTIIHLTVGESGE